MDESDAISALRALGSPTRFRIMCFLVKAKSGMAAGEISNALQVRQNTLSSHVSIMIRCGLLVATRRGRNIIYTADTRTARNLATKLLVNVCDVPQTEASRFLKA
jgi:ArsR family transcriptional regulator, arsenate/arsenite/antimonite-responsive transcriptional repressor